MLRPSPNHGTQRLPNDDDDDDVTRLVVVDLFNIKMCSVYTYHVHTKGH